MTVSTYRRTTRSAPNHDRETMPTIRRNIVRRRQRVFIARRIHAGLAGEHQASSTKRMPTPMRKSVNAMDLIGYQPPQFKRLLLYDGEADRFAVTRVSRPDVKASAPRPRRVTGRMAKSGRTRKSGRSRKRVSLERSPVS